MTPKVCILNEDDARSLTYGGIAHRCSSRRHHHYSKSKADVLVKAGELVWLGKHKKSRDLSKCALVDEDVHPEPIRRSDHVRDAAGARRRQLLTIMKMRALLTLIMATATAYGGTVTGTLQGPSGLPVKNGTLNFVLRQAGLAVGTGSIVPTTASCYTSSDGSVVGMPNPLSLPSTSITYGSGTMAAGIYYVVFTFYNNSNLETLASPELQVQLTGTGSLTIFPPATFPASAAGMRVYVGTASGAETAQGNSTGPDGHICAKLAAAEHGRDDPSHEHQPLQHGLQ